MKDELLKNLTVKNKFLLLTLLVSFSFFASENVFAYKSFKESYIQAERTTSGAKAIDINVVFHDYSFLNYGNLESCNILIVDPLNDPYTLFDIKTPKQYNGEKTYCVLENRLQNALIVLMGFKNYSEVAWPDSSNAYMPNSISHKGSKVAKGTFHWLLEETRPKVKWIIVSGVWGGKNGKENFSYHINLDKTTPKKMEQSDEQMKNTDTINTKEINSIEVYGDADAVIVKGAENGEAIKICNQSGLEIKTVVANQNVSRIELPAQQLYFIYIGQQAFKVAL